MHKMFYEKQFWLFQMGLRAAHSSLRAVAYAVCFVAHENFLSTKWNQWNSKWKHPQNNNNAKMNKSKSKTHENKNVCERKSVESIESLFENENIEEVGISFQSNNCAPDILIFFLGAVLRISHCHHFHFHWRMPPFRSRRHAHVNYWRPSRSINFIYLYNSTQRSHTDA